MQGTVAQVVSLVTYGNLYLADDGDPRMLDFYPTNSTFKFCNLVTFIDLVQINNKKCIPIPLSNTPIIWYSQLAKASYSVLRASYFKSGRTDIPDRKFAGFVDGGGRWMIEAIGPRGSDFWEPKWVVGNQADPEKKIWTVAYRRIAADEVTRPLPSFEATDLKAALKKNLDAILKFAREKRLEYFSKCFETAIACLESDSPLDGVGYAGIIPPNLLSKQAAQLLGAAQAAWVFGGMGSWNDLGFTGKDDQTYNLLSEELYLLAITAILYAVNSSARAK